jgi:hypothetical protein
MELTVALDRKRGEIVHEYRQYGWKHLRYLIQEALSVYELEYVSAFGYADDFASSDNKVRARWVASVIEAKFGPLAETGGES